MSGLYSMFVQSEVNNESRNVKKPHGNKNRRSRVNSSSPTSILAKLDELQDPLDLEQNLFPTCEKIESITTKVIPKFRLEPEEAKRVEVASSSQT